ncbi:MAG: AcrB/AcrD/AcrF family protein [Desulfuromonas sp.]|nr:MAG: AcrB/AcrD/AcrF family protein [Desulfuromonas sp.]
MAEKKLFALNNRVFMLVLTILIAGAGLLTYEKLGRLENPTFTIKTAVIATPYPGAAPAVVEEEVTDPLEEAIQSLSQVKQIYSTSQEGMSLIYVDIKDRYTSTQLPQIWDELRRKIHDTQPYLPPGAGPSLVNDDFGDVYGVFFAITGPGYSYTQLKDYADSLKKELLKCRDVAKIDLWGEQREAIHVELGQARLSRLGLAPGLILQTLHNQNQVQKSGKVQVGDNYLRIDPSGEFSSVDQIADLLIGTPRGMIRLGDIATVTRGYVDPPTNMLRYNGQPAIGLGISTLDGGNVILMGDAIRARLAELESKRPDGMQLNTIYYQSREVTEASDIFLTNLLEAVIIVIVLLLLFMGWRSGLLIGAILLLTILATFAGMYVMGIDFQKVSLGALILALGMLVDNAIVVVDGTLVRMERGADVESAASATVHATTWPLFGATIVAILAFTAIGFSPGNVGEFCRSLFDVLAMSLFFSWVLAISVTPLFCVWFLKVKTGVAGQDPHNGYFYRFYRRFLHLAIHYRWVVILLTSIMLVVALYGFRYVPRAFFPDSTQRYFFVNFWNPQGTHIDSTAADLDRLEHYIDSLDGVVATTGFIGEGGLRFILTYDYQLPNTSYGQLLVEVEDYARIDGMISEIENHLKQEFPRAEAYCKRIQNGPNTTYKIEARFRGPDTDILKGLADQALAVINEDGRARDVRTDWRTPVEVVRPQFSEIQARYVGVSRSDLATALQWNFNGMTGGLYREKNKLIPVIFRAPAEERSRLEDLDNIQVWSSLTNTYVPLRQVTTTTETVSEDALIKRRDRERTVTVQCNPQNELADSYLQRVRAGIEAIDLPLGYSFEWGGEYEKSQESQAPLAQIFPLCILGMFIVVVWLFNSFRRPLIIFMTVPLALIGVTAGLLITGLPFGFMAILGFLGLSGMLIKNAIVLIDQIELDLQGGAAPYKAVLDSSVSRMRPVIMASGTTILGMLPLVTDPFYAAMAATIMSGLFAATFLTLVIVPVMYTKVYKIKAEKRYV